ncbi:MAG: FHA domain-containing protein, partial [Myxococcota bacterium]|nr:FHA domain-containing protein [Myxococcota bacterium]
MPTLRFYRGSELVFEHRLQPGRTTLGRADTCDVSLPDETISRTHCIIQGRRQDWTVIDRSRHGLTIDGQKVEDRASLADGSGIELGGWRVVVGLRERDAAPTAAAVRTRGHENVHGMVEGRVVAERAVLVVEQGPDAGRRVVLAQSRAGVGASGSHVSLSDPLLVQDHVFLRVARGRVMIEPGSGAVFLDGERVRDIMPLHG